MRSVERGQLERKKRGEMRTITSKQELIARLAEEIDMSNEECWPYVDLTAQDVGLRFDSAWADTECDADLDGHELVEFEAKSSREGFEVMDDFSRTRSDYEFKKLFRALSGHKPFRAFRACVEELGILDDWYKFKDEAMLKMSEGVLSDYGVDFIDGRIVCTNPRNVHTFVYESNDDL